MAKILQASLSSMPVTHRCEHEGYEYIKHKFVPFGAAKNTLVSVYEIPPRKAAYPYHFHHNNEETFFILSGQGLLRTPEGERPVRPGEFLFFPTGPEGAHKLTNTSDTENLVYIDFDTVNEVDVTIYPDSGKIGVWGMGVNQVYPQDAAVDYYHGE